LKRSIGASGPAGTANSPDALPSLRSSQALIAAQRSRERAVRLDINLDIQKADAFESAYSVGR
jgi:hypothetical protein